jgi:hypothetical protein
MPFSSCQITADGECGLPVGEKRPRMPRVLGAGAPSPTPIAPPVGNGAGAVWKL